MSSTREKPIVIDSDSEDEAELERVRERGKRTKNESEYSNKASGSSSSTSRGNSSHPSTPMTNQTASSSSSIDFKALNAARQARQEQRERSSNPTSTSKAGKEALQRISPEDRFWDGTVKRGFNQFAGNGVRFSEFILPTTSSNTAGLTQAFVSSYVWDFDWLRGILPTATSSTSSTNPQLTFLMVEGTGATELDPGVHELQVPGWVALVAPSLGRQYVTQHMKFMILIYPDRLRLVICTGNLVDYDWELTENAAFIQDFPLLPDGQKSNNSDVYDQLSMILKSFTVPNAHPGLKALSKYDFQKGPMLVASIGTRYPVRGWGEVVKVGLGRLGKKAREILGGSVKGGGVYLEAQTSSMSKYSPKWLRQLHMVCSGVELSANLPLPLSQTQAKSRYEATTGCRGDIPLKIFAPTKEFVEERSILGPGGGGCHFGKSDEKERMYHAEAVRHPRILMHQKGLLALKKGFKVKTGRTIGDSGAASEGSSDEVVGWVYMGSANFSTSAWGTLTKAGDLPVHLPDDGATVHMSSNNWELGVIFPVTKADLEPEAEFNTMARSAICWKSDAPKYAPYDIAWNASEHLLPSA